MFMFGRKEKTRGIELIEEVMARFTTMIDELNEGVDNCRDERVEIQDQIASLHQRDVVLDQSLQKAATITSNLRNLIGE